jgi:UTP:GlnB (protein PII) uridylyltransferase
VHADGVPPPETIRHVVEAAIARGLAEELASSALPEAEVRFDRHASPWHTTCEVGAPDKPHLLHQLATAFAAAGVDVVSATVDGHDGRAYDTFLLDAPGGGKLQPAHEASVVEFVEGGVTTRHRRWRRPTYAPAQPPAQSSRLDPVTG